MFAAQRMKAIFRHGAGTYEAARIVRDRKSIWMVEYLRARRNPNHISPAFFRRKYFEEKQEP
jgi:hypothetical protein